MPVSNTVTDPEGTPLAGIEVIAEAITTAGDPYPLFDPLGETGAHSRVTTETDANGTWTLTLPAPETMTPSASYYRITERAAPYPDVSYNIRPVTGNEWAGDILVNPPDDITLISGGGGHTHQHLPDWQISSASAVIQLTSIINVVPTDWVELAIEDGQPAGSFDYVIADAQVGDVLIFTAAAVWTDEDTFGLLEIATVVSGSPINWVSGGLVGIKAWVGTPGPGFAGFPQPWAGIGGNYRYTIQAADISAGTVTLRLYGGHQVRPGSVDAYKGIVAYAPAGGSLDVQIARVS